MTNDTTMKPKGARDRASDSPTMTNGKSSAGGTPKTGRGRNSTKEHRKQLQKQLHEDDHLKPMSNSDEARQGRKAEQNPSPAAPTRQVNGGSHPNNHESSHIGDHEGSHEGSHESNPISRNGRSSKQPQRNNPKEDAVISNDTLSSTELKQPLRSNQSNTHHPMPVSQPPQPAVTTMRKGNSHSKDSNEASTNGQTPAASLEQPPSSQQVVHDSTVNGKKADSSSRKDKRRDRRTDKAKSAASDTASRSDQSLSPERPKKAAVVASSSRSKSPKAAKAYVTAKAAAEPIKQVHIADLFRDPPLDIHDWIHPDNEHYELMWTAALHPEWFPDEGWQFSLPVTPVTIKDSASHADCTQPTTGPSSTMAAKTIEPLQTTLAPKTRVMPASAPVGPSASRPTAVLSYAQVANIGVNKDVAAIPQKDIQALQQPPVVTAEPTHVTPHTIPTPIIGKKPSQKSVLQSLSAEHAALYAATPSASSDSKGKKPHQDKGIASPMLMLVTMGVVVIGGFIALKSLRLK
ncbi:hypothetical protein BASA50_004250 [Batrachochytrium salamandrivorans]|uniref:Uncharacterized protein n=1 Tax=Batrachochytrium salamandrivorans TaxID=1357716 RepID=A0ABQ8FFV1_9FUNG|nr:hypothetical protein BASA62_007431 [Batrachochytrium salamandrivorans]KAH6582423.1 hypothetical protein BASA60_001935 [Batrachochytrium salamandrivorans]KAH6597643.1 hypothetical protein BASA50_004250 [Batrachochytrium salamandrivorans]KAH6602152.1 hypothetical protein BASA61_001398 [Batrachochytrium salamandrivorans]